ncbi:YdeI/OmpD-associated family protein, partial [Robiginitalea sp.]|nr:YdeI/OmpD-associated family protein [Robiginitalea sp.]
FDAILVEEAGLKVETKPISDQNIPESLQNLIDNNPEVATAYAALTPGRKRSHIIYISGAKQTATQERRAIQCIEKILKGQGWLERPARS